MNKSSSVQPVFYLTNSFAQNTGDVALLVATLRAIKKRMPEARVIIESTHPYVIKDIKEVRERELFPRIVDIEKNGNKYKVIAQGSVDMFGFGLCALIQRFGMKRISLLAIRPSRRNQARALSETSAILSVPGGYLSTRQFHYAMRLYMYVLGIMWGKKVVLLTQSIGPFETQTSRFFIPKILNKVTAIAVREPESLELLREVNVKLPIEMTSDMAFALMGNKEVEVNKKGNRRVAFCLKSPRIKGKHADYKVAVLAAASHLAEKNYEVIFVSHTLDDDPFVEELAKLAGVKFDKFTPDVFKVQKLYGSCDLVVSSRMHCIILSGEYSTPFVAISYEPKFKGLARQLEYPDKYMINEDKLTSEQLISAIDKLIGERNQIRSLLKPKYKLLEKEAWRNMDWLQEVSAS